MPNLKKITKHTEKQENMAQSKEQNKSTETISEKTKALDLFDKDFKATVSYMLKELKENMNKELKEIGKMID